MIFCSSGIGRFVRCAFVLRHTLIKSSRRGPGVCNLLASIRTNMSSCDVVQRFDDIIKSPEDKREYRGLVLANGLKMLLISDQNTDKSSAAMDVNIGSMSDPKDLPGLAHFCEHMLFLGTEKYPEENEYNKYLNEHGGSSNAFTSSEHTNFYFDVDPNQLEGALDRFAQFFVKPLFTESAVEREVNAVNSENDKNLQNDAWRLHQLEKSTCKEGHDFTKFGTGNRETLLTIPRQNGLDPRAELLKFHDQFYSANIMGLAVLGKESLDELMNLVVPLFRDVANKGVVVPKWLDHPYGPEQFKTMLTIVPIKDVRSLAVMWPTPDLHEFYKTNPGHYLGHLIGHEGSGSLLSELKNRGWVNELVGGQHSGANGFMFFGVNVDLTEDGIEHTEDIVTLIFQYLNLIRKEGPQEWIFNECQNLSAMSFRFKDKERPSSFTCSCAGALHDYPVNEVLSGGFLFDKYDPELIRKILDLLTPDCARVALTGKKFDGQTTSTEKWYGTAYSLAKLDEEKIQKWKTAGYHENLRLPDRNEFIPTSFDLVSRDEDPSPYPIVLRDTSMMRLWYHQDNKFLLPKACISAQFISPCAYVDPLSTNLTHMFSTLLRDALTEYTYAAELAGLHYDIHSTLYGLSLAVKGYNDKQHVMLHKLLDKITTFEIDPKRFEILLEKYVRGLKNFSAEQPHQHAVYYTNVLACEQIWTKDELLDAVKGTTVENLKAFIPRLLSQMFVEMLVYGNVTKQRANELADIILTSLETRTQTQPLLPSQRRRFREVQLPDGCCFVYQRTNNVHKSSSLEVYYQCFVEDTHSNMLLELFCQVIGEPCFDILRTQEQLGYIVFSGVRRSNGVQGLRIIVQSDKSPEYVEGRIEVFLHKMKAVIKDMSQDEFDKHVAALSVRRLEAPKKLSAQHVKYWSEITNQLYNFNRDEIEVEHLKSLTKDDLLKFYEELIAHDAPRRHKLSVHIVSSLLSAASGSDTPDAAAGVTAAETEDDGNRLASALQQATPITDVIAFKRDVGLFPLPKPFITVGLDSNVSDIASTTKSKL